jgi:excisionase family DNA binding protein
MIISITSRIRPVKEVRMKVHEKQELSAIESARKLGVGLDYLYSLLWTGKLTGRKVGRQWRVLAEAVEARLKRRGE